MPQPLIYVDTSDIREGALEELREASRKLAEFIEENEPQLLSYSVYFNEDADQIAFVHVHADQASLDYHMDVAGPRFARFAELLTLRSIHIYGEPSEKALAQLREKVRLLGSGDVVVHPLHAGFGRLELPEQRTAAAG